MRTFRAGDFVNFQAFRGSVILRYGVVVEASDHRATVQALDNGKEFELRFRDIRRVIASFVGWVVCDAR